MAAGQVTFHNHKLVRKVYVKQRENPIVNRLNKTRVEKYPDLRAEKEEDTKKKQRGDRKTRDEQRAKEKKKQQEYEQLKWQKDHAYDDMFTDENLEASNNQDRDEDFLDDFMWWALLSFLMEDNLFLCVTFELPAKWKLYPLHTTYYIAYTTGGQLIWVRQNSPTLLPLDTSFDLFRSCTMRYSEIDKGLL